MKTRFRQQGMSALSVLCVLVGVSFVVTCTVKLLPHYMEAWSLDSTIEKSIKNNDYKNMSAGDIRRKLNKYIDMNRMDSIKAKDMKIKISKGKTQIDATYEKRVPLLANIDVVMKFDTLKYEFPTK
ncbi:DUF4845 domain-containing protein [bacterium AH-315-K03]|nr:DUF4845 domain-containing protein [bacterium AH-315-K03]